MEANMIYKIKENSTDNKEIDLESLLAEVNEKHKILETKNNHMESDIYIALELNYETNYSVKQLGQILDYYGISKKKLKKDELIQAILLFEQDDNNIFIVETRKRLWENIQELKQDKYFSKFIIFNP